MFSKNTYFLPQVSQSVVGFNGAHHEILFHNPHDMVSGHYNLSPNNAPPFIDTSTFFDRDVNELNVIPNSAMINTSQRKQTVKKDRHSKIHTAQGARDRRVRLSIGIARKFFDLQEMLGFDKPSRTLDWLLTKSKAAIKEVAASGKTKSRISSPSECEVVSAENASSDSKSKGKDPCQLASNLAKESRAKARARARERTREKMCIKQLNGSRNTTFDQIPFRVNNNITGNHEEMINYPLSNETSAHDLIQQSIVTKRKMMPSIFGFQQNLFVSRDFSSSYNIPSANATDNWDICAILDQQRFINSTSNI